MSGSSSFRRTWIVSSAVLVLAAATGCSSEDDERQCPSSSPSFAYRIAPGESPYGCDESRDWRIGPIVQEINAFWGSPTAKYCRCDRALLDAGCASNAFVTPNAPGHVYYDDAFLLSLVALTNGRDAAAAWVLAHEMGHNVQLTFSRPPTEPGADCLAGYLIQASVCRGLRGRDDIEAALSTACTVGDPTWFRGGSHGTCQQRITAVQIGMDAYRSGTDPLAACR